MSNVDPCNGKIPSRAKKKLGDLFQEVGNNLTSVFVTKHRKSISNELKFREGNNSKINVPLVDLAGPSTSFQTRVTRSASKEWQGMCGYGKRNKHHNIEDKKDVSAMKPPCNPPVQVLKNIHSGVITRKRYRSIIRDLSRGDIYHSLKVSRGSGGLCIPFDSASSTSEYGTASEDSRNCSLGTELSPLSSSNSCHCEAISGVESLSSYSDADDEGIETDHGSRNKDDLDKFRTVDLSNTGWESDDAEVPCIEWDSKAERDYFRGLGESTKVTLIRTGQVTAIIPIVNCSEYSGDFMIHLKADDDGEIFRHGVRCGMRVHHVSPVVSMVPHGVQFHELFPALIVIPLQVEPQDEAWLSCLCSNTSDGQPPYWERLPKKDYTYRHGCLVITANHFSLFTVILEEPYPEVMKHIRCRTGGRLRLDNVPGVEVKFPRGCLEHDVDAYVRVLFDSEPAFQYEPNQMGCQGALASPIIMLGPHGHDFNASRQPVQITLPVPDYNQIVMRFGSQAKLSVWQSSTLEGEPMIWERLDVSVSEPTLITVNNFTVPVVSFPVHHFSFFKLVWDVLSSSLYDVKMGMSYFYPFISFSMMCQAFMGESTGDNRFGLEVICYRSDKRLPETTNYRHRVGASLKPKLVRPGRILVHLRSQMFDADIEAGEDQEMAKEEPDFRGRDFEKQYACKFKPDVNVERGTFGKVIVERIINLGKDPLFEFNLHKTGFENDNELPMGCERWTVFAMKELAASLQITEGTNWKKFAHCIGFTKNEIKSKLQYSPDPFIAMMNMYNSRGGTPEEFTRALYAVSRDLRMGNTGMNSSHSDRSSSGHSRGSHGSGSKASSSQDSGSKGEKHRLWGYIPWGKVNHDSDSDEPAQKAAQNEKGKKRSHPNSMKKNMSIAAKRRKFSDVSETVTSSSSDEDNEVRRRVMSPVGEKSMSTEHYKKNTQKLNDKDLWRVTSKIIRKDWRNLGRSLGIEEQVLLDIDHAHQPTGFRECAYQMLLEWKGRKPKKCTVGELYSALLREDMIAVAKHMIKQVIVEKDPKDDESS